MSGPNRPATSSEAQQAAESWYRPVVIPHVKDARPGWCAEHPGEELVTPKRAGLRHDWRDLATICPSTDHDPYTRDRCRYCGGPLYRNVPKSGYSYGPSSRRAVCSELCRNYLYRWNAREARLAARREAIAKVGRRGEG